MKHPLKKAFFRIALLLTLIAGSAPGIFAKDAGEKVTTITGTVTANNGETAAGVSITLQELSKKAITNANGEFIFKNIPAGIYHIQASLVGLEPVVTTITVTEGKDNAVKIELGYSSQKLEEVVVSTGGNRFAKKESADVSKMSLSNMENPQAYSVVSKELMKEQLITDYNSAFKNVPGAGVAEIRNQGRTTFISRGFATPQLVRNGVPGFTYTSVDPANLERIEVIKGPSATLFGSTVSSFGGLYNRVTKKPFETFKGEVSYSGGSWDLNRLTADINAPLNSDKTALLRINTALHSEKSFQDAGFTKSYLLAPSFSYKVNDKLTLLLDVELGGNKATSPMRFAPNTKGVTGVKSITDLKMPYNLSFGNNTVNYTSQQYNVFAQIKYKLSNSWTSQTVVSRTRSSSDGNVLSFTALTDSTMFRAVTNQEFPYYGTDIQQNFNGDFYIGRMRNRIVVGLDYYGLRSTRNDATINIDTINFRKPGAAYNNFTVEKISPRFANAKYNNFTASWENTYSAYASDVLNLTDRLLVMASLRVDRYINKGAYYPNVDSTVGDYKQTALSPKFGAVYQVIKDKVSVFGNYMNGFSNVSGSDFEGNTFKPNWANQWEGGVKVDFSKVSATLSYYNISVTNLVMPDPDHANFNTQGGTQYSKGYEAEVIVNPITGLNIISGYTYNNSKITKTDPKTKTEGLRPTTAGPPKVANLWVSYRLTKGAAQGLGIGFGANYASETYQTNTTDFKFVIPSYTVLDAALFYDKPTFRIGLKVDNLTNEKYWSYRLQRKPNACDWYHDL